MTMHWTPLPDKIQEDCPPVYKSPNHPEPGEWVTITGYCGCGALTVKDTFMWPSEPRTYSVVVSCPGSWLCGSLKGVLWLSWTHQGPSVDLRRGTYVRPHP